MPCENGRFVPGAELRLGAAGAGLPVGEQGRHVPGVAVTLRDRPNDRDRLSCRRTCRRRGTSSGSLVGMCCERTCPRWSGAVRSAGAGAAPVSTRFWSTTAEGQDWVVWNGERLLIPAAGHADFVRRGKSPPASQCPGWTRCRKGRTFAAPRIEGQGPAGHGAFRQAGSESARSTSNGEAAVWPCKVSCSRLTVSRDGLGRPPGAVAGAGARRAGPQEISPAMATSDQAGTAVPDNGLPAKVPRLAAVSSPLCVVYGPGLWLPDHRPGGVIPAGALPADAPTTG